MAAGLFILPDKIIFLDRDGVINKKAPEHDYVKTWNDFKFLPYVDKAINLFNNAGFKVIILTNQRGIARKLMSMSDLNNIHKSMCKKLTHKNAKIDDIFVCPHDDGVCNCRKPQIGLFLKAEKKYQVNKNQSFMIGDSKTDIEAGKSYGVMTIAINKIDLGADYRFDDLYQAAIFITGEYKK